MRLSPARILGPVPTLKELNLICWGLFLAFLVLPFCVVLYGHHQSGQPLLEDPEVDFIYFYSMGRLFNDYPAEELYDFAVQKRVCSEVHPLKTGQYGPIPYAPFVGILFRPFARLPYRTAYLVWISISVLLYLTGIAMVSGRYIPNDPLRQSLIFCLALSFYPFINWTIMTGHLSTVGFLALAVALVQEDLGRPVLSGLALSLCLYKPTFIVLILPMLLITRRFKTVMGLAVGGSALALFATVLQGTRIWSGYLAMLLSFGRGAASVQSHSFKQLWKYVDFTSFSAAMPGGRSWLGLAVVLGCACLASVCLLRVWWKWGGIQKPVSTLVWATTLTWTLILNVYVPIYDSILVVLSVIATASVLKDLPGTSIYRYFHLAWLLLFACSWITVEVAEKTGVQIISLSLAALGILQLAAFHRISLITLHARRAPK